MERRKPSPYLIIKRSLLVKAPRLVEIDPMILEVNILKRGNVFSVFRNYLPIEKDVALHLNKMNFSSSKNALCKVWQKLALGS